MEKKHLKSYTGTTTIGKRAHWWLRFCHVITLDQSTRSEKITWYNGPISLIPKSPNIHYCGNKLMNLKINLSDCYVSVSLLQSSSFSLQWIFIFLYQRKINISPKRSSNLNHKMRHTAPKANYRANWILEQVREQNEIEFKLNETVSNITSTYIITYCAQYLSSCISLQCCNWLQRT